MNIEKLLLYIIANNCSNRVGQPNQYSIKRQFSPFASIQNRN